MKTSEETLFIFLKKAVLGISMGAVFDVLRALGFQDDFLKLAADDVHCRKLQDIELLVKK